MTAKEKLDLQLDLSKMIGTFLRKYEFQYKDVIIMLFGITYGAALYSRGCTWLQKEQPQVRQVDAHVL